MSVFENRCANTPRLLRLACSYYREVPRKYSLALSSSWADWIYQGKECGFLIILGILLKSLDWQEGVTCLMPLWWLPTGVATAVFLTGWGTCPRLIITGLLCHHYLMAKISGIWIMFRYTYIPEDAQFLGSLGMILRAILQLRGKRRLWIENL